MHQFLDLIQGRHALIIFEGARVGGGGSCATQQPQQNLCFIYFYSWGVATHTRNLCSAFNPSKSTHAIVNTHPEQWAAIYAAAPGEQLGVRCLAQGSHLSRGIEGGENARIHSPHRQFLPDLRFKPTTSGYKSNTLSIRPRLPYSKHSQTLWLYHEISWIETCLFTSLTVWVSCHNIF